MVSFAPASRGLNDCSLLDPRGGSTILDLSVSADDVALVISVFDEQGNMIGQSSVGAAAQGQGDVAQAIQFVQLGLALWRAGSFVLRVARTAKRATVTGGTVTYQLTKAGVRLALRKIVPFVTPTKITFGVASSSVDLSPNFTGEPGAIEGGSALRR